MGMKLYDSGVYAKPMDLFQFQFGGAGDVSSSNISRARAKGESEKKDDFNALQTIEGDIRSQEQMMEYEKSLLAMSAINQIRSGKPSTDVLNDYYRNLVMFHSAESYLTAAKHAETTKKEQLENWQDKVREKSAGETLIMQQQGDTFVPVLNPYTNQPLTYGNFPEFANQLNAPEYQRRGGILQAGNEYGRYVALDPKTDEPVIDPVTKMALTKPWTIPPPPVYENNAFETELLTNLPKYSGILNTTFGATTDINNPDKGKINDKTIVPDFEWRKSSNLNALLKLTAGFYDSMSQDAKYNLWDQFYKDIASDGQITYNSIDDKGKETVQTEQIIDRNKMEDFLKRQKAAYEKGGEEGRKEFEKAAADESMYRSERFRKYANARIMNKINPAFSVEQGQKEGYGVIGDDKEGTGREWKPGGFNSWWFAVATNKFIEYGLVQGMKVQYEFKDGMDQTKGNNVILAEENVFDLTDKTINDSYTKALEGFFSWKGGNAGLWNIPESEARRMQGKAWIDFKKIFPNAEQLFADPKHGEAYKQMYQQFKADIFNEWLYDNSNPELKEKLIPGSVSKPSYVTFGGTPGAAGAPGSYGTGGKIRTYREVVGGKDMLSLRTNATRRFFPTVNFPFNEKQESELYQSVLKNKTDKFLVAGQWMTVDQLNVGSDKLRMPVVTDLINMLPYYPDQDGNLQPMVDARILVTEKMMANIPIVVDGKNKTLAELDDKERTQAGIMELGPYDEWLKTVPSEKQKTYAMDGNWAAPGEKEKYYTLPVTINYKDRFEYDWAWGVSKQRGLDNLWPEHEYVWQQMQAQNLRKQKNNAFQKNTH